MNIKEAKEQIKNAIIAYLTKDEFGEYQISVEDQRPVFLMGPPGIGKTAIMQQIASELGIGLVSYSMTHHTRQSALGLPFIQTRTYGGKEYSISEYTMSEIIASVYDTIEETGIKEGILFLDEINCVSETLAPSMLQFLQFKTFGKHRVPEGWTVVTAGNPPEYNNSVREFDTVTWDRMKRIDIEPNYTIWKEYALNRGVHPSVSTYLDIKTNDFYKVETTVDGKNIVTARAWLNLSDMIRLYEKNSIKVDDNMIIQYIQDKAVTRSFANYYDLFNKYKSDYQIDSILDGKASGEIKKRAKTAQFDERLSLVGLIMNKVINDLKQVYFYELILRKQMSIFKIVKSKLDKPSDSVIAQIKDSIAEIREKLEIAKRYKYMSDDERRINHGIIIDLESDLKAIELSDNTTDSDAFEIIKKNFNERKAAYRKLIETTDAELENLFVFAEEAFPYGQEILIIVTELTRNYYSAHYISQNGCRKYYEHNKDLLFNERQLNIIREIEELDL